MHNPVKVEFLSRTVTAPDETVARRENVAQRLDEIGQIDVSAGEVNTTARQWCARIGGVDIPLLDWSTQQLDDGKVAVSLVAIVDVLSSGGPETSENGAAWNATTLAAERQQRVIDRLNFAEGQGSEDLPLRPATPEQSLGSQVADNAERTQVRFQASTVGDGVLNAVRDLVRLRGGLGPSGVSA